MRRIRSLGPLLAGYATAVAVPLMLGCAHVAVRALGDGRHELLSRALATRHFRCAQYSRISSCDQVG
jgi:hypothetical protein